MIHKLPMTVIAQFGEVTVFQTAALPINALAEDLSQDASQKSQLLRPSKQLRQDEQAGYGELNLGLHVKDNPAQVLTNRMRLLTAINNQLARQQRLPIKSLHWLNQVHGKQVHDIDTTELNMQPLEADAMVSQQDNIGLAVMTADCVPIVLYQPATGQTAAIHAGWQGLACGVIQSTAARFDCSAPIMAWIGVCISQENYEVGVQVLDQLFAGCVENKTLTAASIAGFNGLFSQPTEPVDFTGQDNDKTQSSHNTVDELLNPATINTNKVKLNLPKLAAHQLAAAGIMLDNKLPLACSYADARYYSYRRQTHLQQSATGRMALVIVRSAGIKI